MKYIIGDVHGCLDALLNALSKVKFNKQVDTLYFVGDLVNRGSQSLETLKFIYNLPNKKVVLGNHDIALLEMYYGTKQPSKYLLPILEDKQADKLIQWLRAQPLFIEEDTFCMSHAGIYPKWNIAQAVQKSKIIENILQSHEISLFLKFINKNNKTTDVKYDNAKDILYKFILMRYLDKNLNLDFNEKKHPHDVKKLQPWYTFLKPQKKKIFFGHWASLGKYEDSNVSCIDAGCVWGGELIVMKI